MRPRRIFRRFVARARNWGTPHVHCPGCGADAPVPDPLATQRCFTCQMEWLRLDLSGDDAQDWEAIRGRAGAGQAWAVTWHPLLVDVPHPSGGKGTETLNAAFLYFPESKP